MFAFVAVCEAYFCNVFLLQNKLHPEVPEVFPGCACAVVVGSAGSAWPLGKCYKPFTISLSNFRLSCNLSLTRKGRFLHSNVQCSVLLGSC